jgi:L-threonylcarbamoyladenylate synthase
MGEAEFVIGKDERTRGGSLPGSVLENVAEIIQQGGFVLLPSDTCYSIAAQPPRSEDARRRINTLLGRTDIPISLAFSSWMATRQ